MWLFLLDHIEYLRWYSDLDFVKNNFVFPKKNWQIPNCFSCINNKEQKQYSIVDYLHMWNCYIK